MESFDEDWFYDSISRYKNLNMFELELPIQQMEPLGTSNICVACSDSQRHQLLQLSLPSKLLSQAGESSDNTITSDTNLKIKCGTFMEKMCYQIKAFDEHKVVASHVDTKGVALYSLSPDTDEIKKECLQTLLDLESPMIATNDTFICLTKKRADRISLFDVNAQKPHQFFTVDEKQTTHECDERIVPMFLRPDVMAFGRQKTGGFWFIDYRVPPGSWIFESPYYNTELGEVASFWSFASLYECSRDFINTGQNICFAKVSKDGALLVYDTRNLKLPAYFDDNVGLKTENPASLQVRFKPGSKDWVSVSGLNGNVYIYQLNTADDSNLAFTHDGHKHADGFTPHTEVTCHWWSKLENLIISAADNGTIQTWQFERKKTDRGVFK